MKLLLVQPPGVQKGFTRSGTLLPPLGLLYIAASVRDFVNVRLIDAEACGFNDIGVLNSLNNWSPDLVGMTVSILTLQTVRCFSEFVKSETGAKVIVGGPLPTAAPDIALECKEFDYVGIGDGELIMPEICRCYMNSPSLSEINGVLAQGNNSKTETKIRRSDPHGIPIPAWDMIPSFDSYYSPDCLRKPVTIIEGSRGCAHSCAFCSVGAISGNKRRSRALKDILAEIKYLISERGIRELSFVDPDFMSIPTIVVDLCNGMQSLEKEITWFCNAGVRFIQKDVTDVMKKAGCHMVYLGLESGDPNVLAQINKNQTLEQVQNACDILRDSGIGISAGFIIGFPFDTDDSVRKTIDFAISLKPDQVQFSLYNWFPGSRIIAENERDLTVGFHPNSKDNKWVRWQEIAYAEFEQAKT